jgi:CRISPR-associated protein Cas2
MKKTAEQEFIKKVRLIRKSGISDGSYIEDAECNDTLDDLETRIGKILNLYKRHKLKAGNMIYFIMYDITNNKVRHQIAKYLENKGCTRVQKSIFIKDSDRKTFREIHESLKVVQEMYDNEDSILIVPVSADLQRSMKIIGQDINFDMVLGNKNTLFF